MRRTYRSKKETGGVLERRDLMLNMDEKSSAFDAFYIQNIKQTKRELSCVGSNTHGVASNRVRKKKYVKRIVKEVETPVRDVCRESLSRSAYLTPDKSIRVNKPLDPFDMLLNSSTVGSTDNLQSVSNKVDLYDKLLHKKEGKTYTRKRPVNTKKFNYSSSDTTDSDKENSDDKTDATLNASNIKAHKLLIEIDAKTSPKTSNDSIYKIVDNLSMINRLKHKSNYNESFKSTKFIRQKFINNTHSPILQKSPLCSTPFKMKYRGESIFKFSPILNDKSPHCVSITEDNDNSNDSVVFPVKDKVNCPQIHRANILTIEEFPNNSNNMDKIFDKPRDLKPNETKIDNLLLKESTKLEKTPNLFSNNTTPSSDVSVLVTTESEPFLGFSIKSNGGDDNKLVNDLQLEHCIDKNENANNFSTMAKNDETVQNSSINSNENYSLYDTCSSEHTSDDERIKLKKEPIVKINRMTDSALMKYSKKINNYKFECDQPDRNTRLETGNNSLEGDVVKTLECDNNKHSEDEEFNSFIDCPNSQKEKFIIKQPIVKIKKMNDSLVMRYYEKIKDFDYEGNEAVGNISLENYDIKSLENDSNQSWEEDSAKDIYSIANITSESDDNKVLEGKSGNILNDFDNNIRIAEENHSLQEDLDRLLLNEDFIVLSSNDDDAESNSASEEKCISFVTTRKRNVSNQSFISMFNNSYASSSTDCDKTVLSNNRKTDINTEDKEVTEHECESADASVIESNTNIVNLNTDSENEELQEVIETPSVKEEAEESYVANRFSNITDRKSSIRTRKSTLKPKKSLIEKSNSRQDINSLDISRMSCADKPGIVLQPGKKWERSLSIYRRMTMITDHFDRSVLEDEPIDTKGRKYRQSVISTMEMQDYSSLHNESINSRRSTFVSKPSRSTIRFLKDSNTSRLSLSNTSVFDDLKGFLNEECDDTIIELSKLSIADQTHEVTVLDNFHDTSHRIATARDYVLRRCIQTDAILFDECYPDSTLKNCHKIGEGVYGEVFLWRARDGRARVLKIVPIAGTLKVNGESQKDFHEIISEIVIAMELSALRAPIAEIERHFDEGKDVEALDLHAIENATDIFNEVLAVRCVYGSYPSRLLDLWDLYDECKGSENDNPAILPADQQYIVLELANAGQDLESYQFNNAEQAHALFLQVAYGLAVAEEAFQFEHRDLHWGNVLIAPTDQKFATFVIRGRAHRVARCGVAATIIDYSLSRVSLPLAGECAALYNDLATDDSLFEAVGDYQFQVYRLMRDKLGNDWKNFEPYTNILWLHYTVDKMITALRYKRTTTKIHKHYIDKLKGIKNRILGYGSAALFVLTDNEI